MPQNTKPQTAITFDAKYIIKPQFAFVAKSLFFSNIEFAKTYAAINYVLKIVSNCLWNII